MLVDRKQEWNQYSPPESPKSTSPKRRRLSKPDKGFGKKCLKLVVVAIAAAMMITVQSEAMVRAGYDLVQMKKEAAKVEKENDALRLEIAKLKSPQRIVRIASSELGMVKPQTAYFAVTKPAEVHSTGGNAGTAAKGSLDSVAQANGKH
ncbi:MAG: cell division protein FtsL family protein [Firmicutes bacterium]|nr:cell division protein FtsL family protein [Bacillota bacterium]